MRFAPLLYDRKRKIKFNPILLNQIKNETFEWPNFRGSLHDHLKFTNLSRFTSLGSQTKS